MKYFLLLAVLFFFGTGAFAQKNGELKIEWKYTGIVEGYDHLSKLEVYVDGILKGSSPDELMSDGHVYKIKIPVGTHKIKLVSLAKYQGTWEAQNVANDYSFDMVYETALIVSKKTKLKLHFDIDAEVINAE